MKYKRLKFTVISADDLPRVRRILPMRVYAVVSCNDSIFKTPVDTENGRNPRWRKSFVFWIDAESVRRPGTYVVVKLYFKRTWRRDKAVGDEVAIELNSLHDMGVRAEKSVAYTVCKARGGTLNILYNFVVDKKPSIWSKIFGCFSRALPVALAVPALV